MNSPNPKKKHKSHEIGLVRRSSGYLFNLEGLPSVKTEALLQGGQNEKALVTALDENLVEAILLEGSAVVPGETYYLAEEGLSLPVGEQLLGRVINPLGVPLDGKGSFADGKVRLDLNLVAPGISSRELISEQLLTGIALVDLLLPIGKGQRELVFGEPRSGKTSFLLDLIVNQRNRDVVCIYVFLGKEEVEVRRFVKSLRQNHAEGHTLVISSSSLEKAPLITIAPTVGLALAESFRDQGRDVLLILDDLGVHAKYWREIALLSGRVPGRESYPGDIFYQHARLVERAGNFNQTVGGGSITLLPVIETDLDNFSTLIPTNLMSATDGHLLFTSASRSKGNYPAIDIGGSVTRVGKQTQFSLQQELAYRVRVLLNEFRELEKFSRFDTELSPETKLRLRDGEVVSYLLRQERLQLLNLPTQIFLLSLAFVPAFVNRGAEFAQQKRDCLIQALQSLPETNKLAGKLNEYSLDELLQELGRYVPSLINRCQ